MSEHIEHFRLILYCPPQEYRESLDHSTDLSSSDSPLSSWFYFCEEVSCVLELFLCLSYHGAIFSYPICRTLDPDRL